MNTRSNRQFSTGRSTPLLFSGRIEFEPSAKAHPWSLNQTATASTFASVARLCSIRPRTVSGVWRCWDCETCVEGWGAEKQPTAAAAMQRENVECHRKTGRSFFKQPKRRQVEAPKCGFVLVGLSKPTRINFSIPEPPHSMAVMTPLPRPNSPRRAQSCPEPGTNTHPKKRRRFSEVPETNEELIVALTSGSSRPRGRPRDPNKVPLTATHEIRLLRAQVASMEEELQTLQSKWAKQLPDERMLCTAHRSARQKHAASQSERAHTELQQLLRQQQLLFATLQTAVLHAPLHSNGSDMFDALHFDTQLGRDTEEREKMLAAHNERSLATLPSIVDKFSQLAINKALAKQSDDAAEEFVMPLSQIEITGCKDCTLISSVFISEIPHGSLEEVYAAVLAYFDSIPTSMKKHFGVETKRRRLNNAEASVVYRRSTFNGSGVPSTVNNIVCSELTASHGMVHIDAVTEDPLHPVTEAASSQFGICGLTITPRKEPVTGKTLAVTLRWVVVYRYNMLPCDPAIKEDLGILRPILNGDLITASVCGYIQQQQKS